MFGIFGFDGVRLEVGEGCFVDEDRRVSSLFFDLLGVNALGLMYFLHTGVVSEAKIRKLTKQSIRFILPEKPRCHDRGAPEYAVRGTELQ